MEQKNSVSLNIDITCPILLTLVFFLLRRVEVIDWAWYWIISPIYVYAGIVLIMFFVFFIVGWAQSFMDHFRGGPLT